MNICPLQDLICCNQPRGTGDKDKNVEKVYYDGLTFGKGQLNMNVTSAINWEKRQTPGNQNHNCRLVLNLLLVVYTTICLSQEVDLQPS